MIEMKEVATSKSTTVILSVLAKDLGTMALLPTRDPSQSTAQDDGCSGRKVGGWRSACLFLLLLCTSCTSFHTSAPPPAASAQWYLASVYQRLALARHQ